MSYNGTVYCVKYGMFVCFFYSMRSYLFLLLSFPCGGSVRSCSASSVSTPPLDLATLHAANHPFMLCSVHHTSSKLSFPAAFRLLCER